MMDAFVSTIFDFFSNTDALIQYGGLGFVVLFVYLETAFFLGIVMPGGDYFVFTSGLLCGTQYIQFPLILVIVLAATAATLGDYTGYLQGKALGPRLYNKPDSWFFKRSYLTRSEQFYKKYGAWTFIIGRYFPIIRTILPALAGAVNVDKAKFVPAVAIGATQWITVLMTTGYLLGHQFPHLLYYSHYILYGIIIFASIPIGWQLILNIRDSRREKRNLSR
jgi:membrane-associated protein